MPKVKIKIVLGDYYALCMAGNICYGCLQQNFDVISHHLVTLIQSGRFNKNN